MQPLLAMHGISKSFGATQALVGVELEMRSGEVMALIGENGAGKSTLMKILSGAVSADAGTMEFGGIPYAPRGPHHARLAGVAMIYQELNLAPDSTVEDNIMLGQEESRWGFIRRSTQRARVRHALELLGHPELHPKTPLRELSIGAQQLVEIARALVHDARVIVFDEPTSSLTLRDAEHLFGVIRKLRAAGLGVVYISHFLEEIRRLADRFSVLRDGRSVGSGELASVTEKQLVSLMVGRDIDELFPKVPHQPAEEILSVLALSGRKLPHEVSFCLRRGEIFGLFGLVGAGRTELLRCLFGLAPLRDGQLRIGQLSIPQRPQARMNAGLGFVSEDRKREGLAQDRSIADNITINHLSPYSRFGWLNLTRRREAVEHWSTRLQIKARHVEQPVRELSGGNQQKVALARVLHQNAEILLLDEPTRGIDVGTKAEIYRMMGELAADGKAVLFVSSYLPELLSVCDTLGVMSRGWLKEVRPVSEWTQESVMTCAVGGDK